MISHPAAPTVRLFESLLPPTGRLDLHLEGDAQGVLFRAWHAWRCCGRVPTAGLLRDLIATRAHLLGGVAHELRRRPRPTKPNDETRGSLRTAQLRIDNAEGKGGDR